MIQTFTPYDLEQNLARAYNRTMAMLPGPEDWAVIRDDDTLICPPRWKHKLAEIIEKNPQYSCLSAVTNRCMLDIQRCTLAPEGGDMQAHYRYADKQWEIHQTKVIDCTQPKPPISGFFFLLQKKAWLKIDGINKHPKRPNGFYGVDNMVHYQLHEAGLKTGVMRGFYVYHYYRGATGGAARR